MIALLITDVPFEQDIRELFMAFYPGKGYIYVDDPAAEIRFTAEAGEDADACAGYTETDDAPAPETAPEAEDDSAEGIYRMTLSVGGRSYRFSSVRYKERLWSKNALKRALYKTLCKENGRTLPWGTLTGIRPAKLALTELMEGVSSEEVRNHLKERYFVSDLRNDLCVRTAENELKAVQGLDLKKGWSLYIGIPFCPTTCLYCSFTSYPIAASRKKRSVPGDKSSPDQVTAYIDALCGELRAVAEIMRGRKLETIYMGGGTPTSLEASELERILTTVRDHFDLQYLKELTVEAGRPDSITAEKLETLKKCGVTRISINPQTLKQETLDLIGRRHTVDQFRECFCLARSLGFDNINTDLIAGLPNETAEDMRRTMEGIRELAPDDVTIHSLALKRASRLNTRREDYADVQYGSASDMITLAAEYCGAMGLHPYYLYRQKNMAGNLENVGWCRPGREGLYNILIMEELQTIVGTGAGTTTRVMFPEENRYERAENVKDPLLYVQKVDEMIERKRRLLDSWLGRRSRYMRLAYIDG
ncbi:MAG: coproporphyrinogen dehydrogenase HemZ [Stomatobaculum sp.]|nr:coproporphyrinogen dehydrogenase HemZ [Stomatobaculum sp.]